MVHKINESQLRKIIKNIIRESAGIPSEEEYYINTMVPRIKSWMEEVYKDWGGLDSVSPEALTDFSSRDDYEETLDTFSHEFNVDREELRPVLDKALSIAYNRLKEELSEEGISESAEISEKEVTRFTPYTPEEREQNFAPFRGGDRRSAFDRNDSYRRALEAARKRQMEKKLGESRRINGIIDTVIKEYINRS